VQPYDPGSPCTIEVEYKVTSAVDKLRHVSGIEIVDARRIRSTAETWWEAWRQFFFFG
jgi:D-aminopeptidase